MLELEMFLEYSRPEVSKNVLIWLVSTIEKSHSQFNSLYPSGPYMDHKIKKLKNLRVYLPSN